MYVKVTEAAKEFVATQKIASETINWNSTAVMRAWNKLREAVEEHLSENITDRERHDFDGWVFDITTGGGENNSDGSAPKTSTGISGPEGTVRDSIS